MKIAVCVSHVPDTTTKIVVNEDGTDINKDGIAYIINPYDEFAIEEALKTKEKAGDPEVIVISVGNETNKDSIKKALAMGCDSGVLLKTDSQLDSVSVAKLLADEIKELGAEIVFMGKQSIDHDNSVVPQMSAELLGFNSVSVVVGFSLEDGKIVAEREIEGGVEIVETKLPAVISTQKGLNTPRYASLKGIMQAKKKTIVEKEVNVENNLTENIKYNIPPGKSAGKILGDDSSSVPELIKLLKEEANII